MPACIEELRPPAVPPPAERRAALRLMDQILRTTLLQVDHWRFKPRLLSTSYTFRVVGRMQSCYWEMPAALSGQSEKGLEAPSGC